MRLLYIASVLCAAAAPPFAGAAPQTAHRLARRNEHSAPDAHGIAPFDDSEGDPDTDVGHSGSQNTSSVSTHGLHGLGNISLVPLTTSIRAANWSGIVQQIKDPHNRSYLVSCGILFCLGLTTYGHRLLKLWLFLGGFISVAVGFYFFAPKMLSGTQVCCGAGTEKEHVLISVGLGIFAGGVALWILKVGIFLGGSCLGLFISLAMRTSLAHMNVFQSEESFALFYFGAALVGGMVALYKDRPIIIALTAFGGAFGVVAGVGYFDDCDFSAVITHVEQEVASERTPGDLPQCIPVHVGMYFALAIAGMAIQCGCVPCLADPPAESSSKTNDRGASYLPVSKTRSGGLLQSDEEMELKELLVRNYIRDEAKRHRRKEKKRAAAATRHRKTRAGAHRHGTAASGGGMGHHDAGEGTTHSHTHHRTSPSHGVVHKSLDVPSGKRKVYRKKVSHAAHRPVAINTAFGDHSDTATSDGYP
eukprot:m.178842 g.178842  ORF g.178842 m.178842 type:complete len:475 (+) comp14634_c0_seq1:82-1506(+)